MRRAALVAALLLAGPAQAQPAPTQAAAPPAADCETLANTDPEAAHRLAERTLAAEDVTTEAEVGARMCLVWSHVRTGQAALAREQGQALLRLAREGGLAPALRTAALRRAGSAEYALGSYNGAIELFVEALDIAEAHGLTGERIGLLVNMGVVRGQITADTTAHAHFEEALRLMEDSGIREHEAPLLNNYGVSLVANGEPARGLELLERALALAEAAGNAVGIAHVTHSMGFAQRQLGNMDEAEQLLDRALAERRALGARAGEAATLVELARVHIATGRPSAALSELEAALAVAQAIDDKASERDAHDLLSRLHEARGNAAEALQSSRRHAEVDRELMSERNLQRLADFETRQRNLLAERELELLRRDNHIQALELRTRQLHGLIVAGGLMLLSAAAVAGVALMRRSNRRLQRISATDDLTGLPNRRDMTALLDRLQANGQLRARADSVRESVLYLVDIDHFKAINDRHGHDAGDFVLRALAERLLAARREGDDRIGRWGGEEFLLVARGLDQDQAGDIAERLRQSIAGTPLRLPDGAVIAVTASIGFAPWPFFSDIPAQPWRDALRIADRALYLAKAGGRNASVGLWGTDRGGDVDAMLADVSAAQAAGVVERISRPGSTGH